MGVERPSKLRPVGAPKTHPTAAAWRARAMALIKRAWELLCQLCRTRLRERLLPKLRGAFQGPGSLHLSAPTILSAMIFGALLVDLFTHAPWPIIVGAVVLSALVLRQLYLIWFQRLPVFGGEVSARQIIFLWCILLILAGLSRGYNLLALAMSVDHGGLALQAMGYAVPLAAGPLLVSLFMSAQAGMLTALGFGLLASLLWPGSMALFVYYLITGVVAAHYVRSGHTRMSLIGAAAWSALSGALALAAMALVQGWLFSAAFMAALAAALLGSLLAGILAAGMAPLAESAFGFISAPCLMELASLDHPLLQELMLQAPGTYHHSLVVGSLVEAAAKEIGANSLLAKVAALYHDLGKLRKCDYFVENQGVAPNRHEKLAPTMSALILISHVKEGVEAARRHRLGQPIIDIIGQHHGTRLIHYFYNKALECSRETGREEPNIESFRYPGPRPQTREAGLVMLADTVEAASRSLDNPTPARIQGLVQSQINKVFAEGQLDECELTLKDLHKIAKVFNKILNGIFHHRVEYPNTDNNGPKKQNDSCDRQSTKPGGDRPDDLGIADQTNLRRLGVG
ncbi:7TM receptor with intracellular metal dependent phosphohydrolase [Desulfarculus baarsii DSM 2075]|uniref:7TM receptor with intracellular metal dependent phosphohydrolase n=2 Tax=Desulfarculus baarsii TaxID=453230 RepID=E1QFI4_DESB2|nr:7TM receptor with intracellular metal dependent phosphohydrolase [Desulfarculus baarsii DSM 2075]